MKLGEAELGTGPRHFVRLSRREEQLPETAWFVSRWRGQGSFAPIRALEPCHSPPVVEQGQDAKFCHFGASAVPPGLGSCFLSLPRT
jgi:hypothetical protein